MTITKQWPSGSDNPTPQNFNIPEAGEKNWSSLSNFLSALAGGTQATTFQKIAIRQATTTPITIASNDCLVTSKLAAPGAVTVNLPAGVAKQIFYIYDETGDASTNNITINRSGTDTIEGATSLVVNTDKELVGLAFDSSSGDWKIFVRCRPNISVGSISGLGAGVAAWLADPTSAKLATAVTDETGSGLLVFNNGPTFVAPALGTPASGVLTNCTGLPISSLTGSTTGTGALVFATSPTLVTPALGTPSSGTLSNCGGLPLTTGVTGILPIANGGTNASAKTAAFDNLSPLTTKGDLVGHDGSNNTRTGVGANGTFLKADSTASAGFSWDTPPGSSQATPTALGTVKTYTSSQEDQTFNIGDANYTVLDTDGYGIIYSGTTLTTNRTVTLPTLADNQGRVITIVKGDSSSFPLLFDGEGSETVDGNTDKRLISQYDSATVVAGASSWYYVAGKLSPVRQFAAYNASSGSHGSTANKIPYLPTSPDSSGSGLFTVANDSTNGTVITITKRCWIYISYIGGASSGGSNIGISKNASSTTTAIQSISAAQRVAYTTTPAANGADQVSYSGIAETSDVFRPHTEGSSLITTASRNTLWIECMSIDINQ